MTEAQSLAAKRLRVQIDIGDGTKRTRTCPMCGGPNYFFGWLSKKKVAAEEEVLRTVHCEDCGTNEYIMKIGPRIRVRRT